MDEVVNLAKYIASLHRDGVCPYCEKAVADLESHLLSDHAILLKDDMLGIGEQDKKREKHESDDSSEDSDLLPKAELDTQVQRQGEGEAKPKGNEDVNDVYLSENYHTPEGMRDEENYSEVDASVSAVAEILSNAVKKDGKYVCPICGKKFYTEQALSQHTLDEHTKMRNAEEKEDYEVDDRGKPIVHRYNYMVGDEGNYYKGAKDNLRAFFYGLTGRKEPVDDEDDEGVKYSYKWSGGTISIARHYGLRVVPADEGNLTDGYGYYKLVLPYNFESSDGNIDYYMKLVGSAKNPSFMKWLPKRYREPVRLIIRLWNEHKKEMMKSIGGGRVPSEGLGIGYSQIYRYYTAVNKMYKLFKSKKGSLERVEEEEKSVNKAGRYGRKLGYGSVSGNRFSYGTIGVYQGYKVRGLIDVPIDRAIHILSWYVNASPDEVKQYMRSDVSQKESKFLFDLLNFWKSVYPRIFGIYSTKRPKFAPKVSDTAEGLLKFLLWERKMINAIKREEKEEFGFGGGEEGRDEYEDEDNSKVEAMRREIDEEMNEAEQGHRHAPRVPKEGEKKPKKKVDKFGFDEIIGELERGLKNEGGTKKATGGVFTSSKRSPEFKDLYERFKRLYYNKNSEVYGMTFRAFLNHLYNYLKEQDTEKSRAVLGKVKKVIEELNSIDPEDVARAEARRRRILTEMEVQEDRKNRIRNMLSTRSEPYRRIKVIDSNGNIRWQSVDEPEEKPKEDEEEEDEKKSVDFIKFDYQKDVAETVKAFVESLRYRGTVGDEWKCPYDKAIFVTPDAMAYHLLNRHSDVIEKIVSGLYGFK